MYYDGAGNMTSVTGTEFGSKTLVYDDENRLTSITYGGVTDTYTYNWQGLRTRAVINGVTYRYLYNGERVLQELTDAGAVNATYTTENDSYYGSLLHLQRATGESRFPLYDEIGSARGLVDASGTVTDTYDMDTFGKPVATTGSTPNPYRFGAAWGYITDPSGFLQLGARYYWPEVGRFVSQDPVGEETNSYGYAEGSPTTSTDPAGLKSSRSHFPGSLKNPLDHIKCARIMRRYYNEMRRRNWIGADSYYHCIASCECAHKTNQAVSWVWGVNREMTDMARGKGMSKRDLRADYCGVKVPRSMSCKRGCEVHRPKGMPRAGEGFGRGGRGGGGGGGCAR